MTTTRNAAAGAGIIIITERMVGMNDGLFGELTYDEGIGWCGSTLLAFGGSEYDVQLLINAEEDAEEISALQQDAFLQWMRAWDSAQENMLDALIDYYNQQERFAYGPDDETENALLWQEINTREAMMKAVTPETIVIPSDYLAEGGRTVYLLLGKAWGGEDLDDNGVGVRFVNEQIAYIGYKDIAF